MADKEEKATGPWDVVMYVVQRFPMIAVMLLLVGAGVYGAKLTLEERHKAEKELLLARQEIEKERNAARTALEEEQAKTRRQLDEQRREVAAIVEKAIEREKAAAELVAEAKATALADVQDTLLTASERIQNLVLGQVKSMEDIEELRTSTATELQRQLADLTKRRDEMQAALVQAENKYRVARLTFAIDGLQEALSEGRYRIDEAIDTVIDSFDQQDPLAMAEITKRATESKERALRASLQYALALKTRDEKWAQEFAKTFAERPEDLGASWVNSVFRCCNKTTEEIWNAVFPVAVQIVTDDQLDFQMRFMMTDFFSKRPNAYWREPMFSNDAYVESDDIWAVVSFLIGSLTERSSRVDSYQRTQTPAKLAMFDLAAAHVWASALLDSADLNASDKLNLERFVENWQQELPIFKEPPAQDIINFWTSADLLTVRSAYRQLGTSEDYQYSLR